MKQSKQSMFEIKDITFENLRYKYETGRAYTVSGTGRDRVMGYRTGVQTKLGDIEISEWMDLMQELIEKSGEQELHAALVEWMTEHNYRKAGKSEIAREAMELHSNRIFDNEEWVDFLPFNCRYRPEILSGVETVEVFTDCCQQWGPVTRRRLNSDKSIWGRRVSCPRCGRLSEYHAADEENESEEEKIGLKSPSAEEIDAAARVALRKVRKTMWDWGIKYRPLDFSYPTKEGGVENREADNSIKCAMNQHEQFSIYVSLSYKCKKMGRRLKAFVKENPNVPKRVGAQVTSSGVVFTFPIEDLTHTT